MLLYLCFKVAKPNPHINKAMFWVIPRALSLQQGWFSLQKAQQSCRGLLLQEKSKIYRANLGKLHADGNPA